MLHRALLLALAILICGCTLHLPREGASGVAHDAHNDAATPPALPEFAEFGVVPEIPEEDALFALSPEQISDFFAYYHAQAGATTDKVYPLTRYINAYLDDFDYQNETLSAQQALSEKRGDCLSIAILSTALARLLDLDIHYHLLESIPVYDQQKSFVIAGDHVRSKIVSVDKNKGFARKRHRTAFIDVFPVDNGFFDRAISKNELVARYYQNLAAKSMIDRDYNRSFWLLKQALHHDPLNGDSLSMMAVIHRRIGDAVRAEKIFRFGLQNAKDRHALVNNYEVFLMKKGRIDDLRELKHDYAHVVSESPVRLLNMAVRAYRYNRFDEAIALYSRVSEIAPNVHQSYFGIAKSYAKLGQYEQVKLALLNASEKANRVSDQEHYLAKLDRLTRLAE